MVFGPGGALHLKVDAYAYALPRAAQPENVLLIDRRGGFPDLRIADFGCARRLGPNTTVSSRAGTLGYMAPEVVAAAPHGLPADLWSVGVILYTLLSGHMPFRQANHQLDESAVREGRWSFSHPNWDEVSFEGKDMVRRLLRNTPHARPTAHEALELEWMRSPTPDGASSPRGSLPGSSSLQHLSDLQQGETDGHLNADRKSASANNLASVGASEVVPSLTQADGLVPDTPSTASVMAGEMACTQGVSPAGASEPCSSATGDDHGSGANCLPQATKQPQRSLSASNMAAGTDEHGVRIRMFTATVTCGRAVRAGLAQVRSAYTRFICKSASLRRERLSREAPARAPARAPASVP